MNWKFWEKREAAQRQPSDLPKPMDLPNPVGRYLVVNLKIDPDVAWSYRAVVLREKGKSKRRFRVFDPAQANALNIRVRDYHSLDQAPELILYSGVYNTSTGKAEFHLPEGTPEAA